MGRTKLRALEVAGVRIGIEAPDGYDWRWPRGTMPAFQVAAHDVDVHVGVRVGRGAGFDADEVPWTFRSPGALLEWVQTSDGWTGVVHGDSRFERVARFDAAFRTGDVIVDPQLAATGAFPLDAPLGELVWLHRIVRAGGLLVAGDVQIRDGRATLILPAAERGPAAHAGSGERWVALCVDARGDVLVFDTPWSGRARDRVGFAAPLHSIHLVEQALDPYVETAEPDEAAERLVAHAFAPVHDAALAERILSTALRIAESSTLRVVGLPGALAAAPADSAAPWTERPFAPPRWL